MWLLCTGCWDVWWIWEREREREREREMDDEEVEMLVWTIKADFSKETERVKTEKEREKVKYILLTTRDPPLSQVLIAAWHGRFHVVFIPWHPPQSRRGGPWRHPGVPCGWLSLSLFLSLSLSNFLSFHLYFLFFLWRNFLSYTRIHNIATDTFQKGRYEPDGVSAYGLAGWETVYDEGHWIMTKGGLMDGFASSIAIDPYLKIGVGAFINFPNGPWTQLFNFSKERLSLFPLHTLSPSLSFLFLSL